MRISEHEVRERAYYIWEGEGRVHGRAAAHWVRAELELGALAAQAAITAAPKKAVAKPAVAKASVKAAETAVAAKPAAPKPVAKAKASKAAVGAGLAAKVGLAAKAKPSRAPAAMH